MESPTLIGSLAEDILTAFPLAVTVLDPEGRILFYNDRAAELLDRRPEYLGRDLRTCHRKKESIRKIDRMIKDFQAGGSDRVQYLAQRNGIDLEVTVFQVRREGRIAAWVQMVREA